MTPKKLSDLFSSSCELLNALHVKDEFLCLSDEQVAQIYRRSGVEIRSHLPDDELLISATILLASALELVSRGQGRLLNEK